MAVSIVRTEVGTAISVGSTRMAGGACTVGVMVAASCSVGTGAGEGCIFDTIRGELAQITGGVDEPRGSISWVGSWMFCCNADCSTVGGTGVSFPLEGPSAATVDGVSIEELWLASKAKIGVGAGVRDVRLVNEGLGLRGVEMGTSGLAASSRTEVGAGVDSAGRISGAGAGASDSTEEGVGVGGEPPGFRR